MHKPYQRIKRPFLIALSVLCVAGGFFISCKKAQPSWDTNILAPIITTSLSINNLVGDTLIHRNPDSSVSLVYDGTLYNLNTDTLIKMPDTTLLYPYVIPPFSHFSVNPGQPVLPVNNSTTTYQISTVELKKATLQTGFVDIEVRSYINQPTDITYKVPSATLNGNPLVMYIRVPAVNGSSPGVARKTYSLADYSIDFTGPSHNTFNTLNTILSGIVDSAAGVANINSGDSLNIIVKFYSVSPSYAKGYFGTVTKSYTAQAPFPLFSRVIAGSLNLQNISVTMSLANYFGVDARLTLSQLASVNTHTGNTVNLTNASVINNAININRAVETFNPNAPTTPAVQNFSLTPSNSNILQWVDNLPTRVNYSLQVTTDPLGNVSGSNDFAYSGNGIESHLNITVPLSLIATNLTLEDTLSVNFNGSAQAQQVKSGTFTLYADNGFPFSAGMQVYLLDSTMHIADSLMIGPQTIIAGTINNSNGIVVAPQNSVILMSLNTARTQLLLKTKHIIILSKFNMGCASCLPQVYRKIYSYYQLNVKLVGNFDYQIKG